MTGSVVTVVSLALLGASAARMRAWAEALSEAERRRARRFATQALRDRYVAAHGQLRELLALVHGGAPRDVAIAASPSGRPSAARCGDFSLSYAGSIALVALTAQGRVGVDATRAEPVGATLARTCLSEGELAAYRTTGEERRPELFARCWARKEAVLKACGMTIAADLGAIDTRSATVRLDAVGVAGGGEALFVRDLRVRRPLVAAIATTADVSAIRTMRLRDGRLEPTGSEACA